MGSSCYYERELGIMDLKESQLFNEIYQKLADKTFSEMDIYSFYILSREYVKRNGWLRELGDSIAHRTRIKGRIFNKFDTLHRYISGEYSKGNYLNIMDAIPAFNLDGFRSEINTFLEQCGKPKLDESIVKEIMIYTFSLMQFSTYKNGDVKGNIFTFFTHNYVALMAYLTDDSPYYCFAKLDICISTKDIEWWNKNWFRIFRALSKAPFSIKRDSNNTSLLYIGKDVL